MSMLVQVVEQFPDEWRCDVSVTRLEKDRKGNITEVEIGTLEGVMPGWRSTEDPVDFADLTSDQGVVLAGQLQIEVKNGDLFDIPDGPWPSGRWRVAGEPNRWQLGTEIPIRKGT